MKTPKGRKLEVRFAKGEPQQILGFAKGEPLSFSKIKSFEIETKMNSRVETRKKHSTKVNK